MKKKIKLGILFGGRSGEHEVSLVSAASVINSLDSRKYDVVPIGITREGRWRIAPGIFISAQVKSAKDRAGAIRTCLHAILKKGAPVTPSVDPAGPTLLSLSKSASSLRVKVDVVFPVLHGTFGEDGTIQGLLELAAVPCVGAGVLGSSAGMDKDVMKRLFRDAGLPVVPWELVLRSDWEHEPLKVKKRIEKSLCYPLFVKPGNAGSSVGISKVHKSRGLKAAMDLAAQYDRKIIVEKAVDAREIECAVLGNDHPEASVPGEIVPVNEFYDYEAKYIKEGSELVIPARLGSRQCAQVQEMAVRAFKAVDCAGMGRVDFLLDRKSGKVYVNEINTIPGFTSISMYPKMWEASGLSNSRLLDRLVDLALERRREMSRTRYDYTPKR